MSLSVLDIKLQAESGCISQVAQNKNNKRSSPVQFSKEDFSELTSKMAAARASEQSNMLTEIQKVFSTVDQQEDSNSKLRRELIELNELLKSEDDLEMINLLKQRKKEAYKLLLG